MSIKFLNAYIDLSVFLDFIKRPTCNNLILDLDSLDFDILFSNQNLFIPFGIIYDFFSTNFLTPISSSLFNNSFFIEGLINTIASEFSKISFANFFKCIKYFRNISVSVVLTATMYGIPYFSFILYATPPSDNKLCACINSKSLKSTFSSTSLKYFLIFLLYNNLSDLFFIGLSVNCILSSYLFNSLKSSSLYAPS